MIRLIIMITVVFAMFAWFSPESWLAFALAVAWLHLDEWLELKGLYSAKR